ncbi:NAD(P)-dependent oxidoreductase [Roseicella frigidaeris]|uniref:NAD(P)-dependent oxidoreductase n=1 Tax=Roseicella frigidaeris TaxID=2230885 RepID=A0A327M5P8_9PROT|nr:NAD(P)-dependent oxidoreductase [Roseicella frigidaeris]RAI57602.1 NAD(P)-dependent oxidoreductase [Roseicella frigidaeris]
MTDSIGFLGLGSMGGPIVARLAAWAREGGGDHGCRILVHDVRPEAMARAAAAGAEPVAGGARELGARCPLVLACLPGTAISEAVALGEDGVASAPGHALRTYVEMSTIGGEAIRRIAAGLAARGVALVDSPISGGAIGAETGALAVMAAGAPEAVAAARPVLEVVGRRVFTVGETPGLGQAMKLANNLLSLAGMVLTAEALSLGAKAGLDPALMCEVINAGTGRNSSTDSKYPRAVLTGRFDVGSTNRIAHKDMALAMAECAALGVPAPLTGLAREIWAMTEAAQGAQADMTTVAKLYEGWTGAPLRARGATD